MAAIDWVVVAAYVAVVMGIGGWFARRASGSAEEFLVAGRKLPWWVIGLSDVASSAGADAFWILIVFSAGFIGLHRFWWIAAVVSLPLGIVWARYWRRLRLLSPGQIFEERYGGVAAARFRGFFVAYGALFVSGLILGYVMQGFAQIMTPFLGWPQDVLLLVFCGVSVLYTVLSGLLGVAYSDVPQFILLLVARVGLAWVVVAAAGGLTPMLDRVVELRGAEFLQPFPPSSLDLYGKWAVEPLTLVALALAGAFGVAGTGSMSVQRSLAARSEADAALGQAFNAVLTLVVRMAPVVVIGLGAIALLPTDADGAEAWAALVKTHAGPGLLGLVMAGVVAGYMSTVDSFINFMTAGLFNDLYRRHIRPDASEREQVWFCRLATVGATLVAYLWARALIGRIDADWLNFVNSVLMLFVLPLTLLRWVWWRLNIWGEVVAFVAGAPLAWLVWFGLGFKDAPYWQSFGLLFVLGGVVVVVTSLATRPEDDAVLDRFYTTVRPPGWWGPVAARCRAGDSAGADTADGRRRLDLLAASWAFVFCVALVVGLGATFARDWVLTAGCALALAGSGVGFVRMTMAAERSRRAAA